MLFKNCLKMLLKLIFYLLKFLNCIRFFLINFIVLKHYKCQALTTGVCWFEAATYKKE
jgi:hypothetical protein